jgi:hypothetical protein
VQVASESVFAAPDVRKKGGISATWGLRVWEGLLCGDHLSKTGFVPSLLFLISSNTVLAWGLRSHFHLDQFYPRV